MSEPHALIETMAFTPDGGIARLERHMARLQASAEVLGLRCDGERVRGALRRATFGVSEAGRVRLVLRDGQADITLSPMPPIPATPTVAIRPLPVASDDLRLRHKTTDRAFYDDARIESGAFEVVFVDPDGWVTEGSFTNVFVERNGMLLTPPLTRGLLPGVLRGALVDSGRAIERDLRVGDLMQGLWLGNALRGLIPAGVDRTP